MTYKSVCGSRRRTYFQKSFARKNLAYIVRKTEDKLNTLVLYIRKSSGYGHRICPQSETHQGDRRHAAQAGISADFFHAGLNRDEKELRQARLEKQRVPGNRIDQRFWYGHR